jgi:hypothetical protein
MEENEDTFVSAPNSVEESGSWKETKGDEYINDDDNNNNNNNDDNDDDDDSNNNNLDMSFEMVAGCDPNAVSNAKITDAEVQQVLRERGITPPSSSQNTEA